MKFKLLIEGGYNKGNADFGAVYFYDKGKWKILGYCDYKVGLKKCVKALFNQKFLKVVRFGKIKKIDNFQREVEVYVSK